MHDPMETLGNNSAIADYSSQDDVFDPEQPDLKFVLPTTTIDRSDDSSSETTERDNEELIRRPHRVR